MADPLIDEQLLLALLELPSTADNSSRLQQGVLNSLADAYDRKIKRDNFLDVALAALTIKDALGRQQIMRSVDDHYRSGTLNQKLLDEAIEGLTKTVELERHKLYAYMRAISLCPTSKDTLN